MAWVLGEPWLDLGSRDCVCKCTRDRVKKTHYITKPPGPKALLSFFNDTESGLGTDAFTFVSVSKIIPLSSITHSAFDVNAPIF